MIVEPDFLDHWKTRLLVRLLGTETAPIHVLRLWAHCQCRKTDRFTGWKPIVLASVCRWESDAQTFWDAMVQTFIEIEGDAVVVHGWAATNASLISAWNNGKLGGRPSKSTTEKPTGNPPVIPQQTDRATDRVDREEKRRLEGQDITPPTPLKGELANLPQEQKKEPSATVTPPVPEKPHGEPIPAKHKRSRRTFEPMQIPSIEEVKLHFAKIGLPETEAFKFFGHFESNGWVVGKAMSPMRSWVGACTKWKANYDERRTTTGSHNRSTGAHGNPRNAGIAGFDEWHRDFQARAVGDGQHGPWDDFGREPEVEGASPEAGRVAPPADSSTGPSR